MATRTNVHPSTNGGQGSTTNQTTKQTNRTNKHTQRLADELHSNTTTTAAHTRRIDIQPCHSVGSHVDNVSHTSQCNPIVAARVRCGSERSNPYFRDEPTERNKHIHAIPPLRTQADTRTGGDSYGRTVRMKQTRERKRSGDKRGREREVDRE